MLEGSKYEDKKFLGGVIVLLKDDGTFVEYKVPTYRYNNDGIRFKTIYLRYMIKKIVHLTIFTFELISYTTCIKNSLRNSWKTLEFDYF